ncbi:MAG: hypothetical protein H8E26_12545 [FCB group bacterium]|nr:hypothetical protein [FCB group bacterium]MBL7029464.1 hypothetical protein [Candidatus Neomarinimicrobiota bacterium]MBL7123087.1 hypothetical protein [Candidatus Neomarinimicrobiota bacterium]
MRITTIVLLVVFLIIGCENPQDLSSDQTLYQGQVIQHDAAPFLLNGTSLAKLGDGLFIFAEEVPEGIVYGLENDPTVYAAQGGEILPENSWVGNLKAAPVEATLKSKASITFDSPSLVTLIDASDIVYIDENGTKIAFSGNGVVTANEILTGSNGFTTLVSTTKFSIGGDGGEWG